MMILNMQAIPKIGLGNVEQCVDPALGGIYSLEAVVEVIFLNLFSAVFYSEQSGLDAKATHHDLQLLVTLWRYRRVREIEVHLVIVTN
jgi:hypothetical protein